MSAQDSEPLYCANSNCQHVEGKVDQYSDCQAAMSKRIELAACCGSRMLERYGIYPYANFERISRRYFAICAGCGGQAGGQSAGMPDVDFFTSPGGALAVVHYQRHGADGARSASLFVLRGRRSLLSHHQLI